MRTHLFLILTERLGAAVLLALLALPAGAASWREKTEDWTQNTRPVPGDWGFDRPGYPRGLYIHGVTMPEGFFPDNPLPNPIIYDNDEYADILDDDVLAAMARLGHGQPGPYPSGRPDRHSHRSQRCLQGKLEAIGLLGL